MKKTFVIIFWLSVALLGCAHYMPMSVGMAKQDVIEKAGQPVAKWAGANGVECWKYKFSPSTSAKGGTWYVIFKDAQVIKIAERDRGFDSLVIGLPEAAVIELQGRPDRVSATKDTKYLTYRKQINKHQYEDHFVRLANGAVESYGRVGDFDSTKPDEKTLNLNVDDKRKK